MSSAEILFSSAELEPFVLLQLSPELLGKGIKIKSSSAIATVLCTNTATYQLKDVQQSNSLLFLATGSQNDSDGSLKEDDRRTLRIQGEAASWLETTAIVPNLAPHLDKLAVFDPDSDQPVLGIEKYSLYSTIPASDSEIESFLSQHLCVDLPEVSGYVRLDSAYISRLIHVMVNSILASSMDVRNISMTNYEQAIAEEGENNSVLRFLLRSFSETRTDPYSLDSTRLITFLGRHILELEATQPLPIETFKRRWSSIVPATFYTNTSELDLAVLEGRYILPSATTIQSFDSAFLSVDPKTRISELLELKSRWRDEELRPYLFPILSGTDAEKRKGADSMIMKHSRKVKVGKEVFIEKRGK